MYNDEYDDEQDETNEGFIKNFYYNNKVLVWIFLGIIIFILLISLLTSGGSSKQVAEKKYDVVIQPEDEKEFIISIGHSENLVATVSDDPNGRISWSVADENIAKVDHDNVVALNYGRTTITATYIDSNDKPHTDSRDVIVADGDPSLTLTDVSFKNGDLFMPLNSTYLIALNLIPTNAYVENKTFTSSNPSVASVDNKGLVTAVGEGEATITFSVNNGRFTKNLRVYVDRSYHVTEIVITPDEISFDGELKKIKVGTTDNLTYRLSPENADPDKLIWSSDDESVVTVDNGRIRGLKEGHATVTVSSINGTKDKIDIEVESDIIPVSDINLSVTDISLTVGQTQVITPVISPDNASNKALSYTSQDSSIASVSPNETGTQATITASSVGYTTITISASNNVEKQLNVTVTGNSGGSSNGGSSNSGSSGGGDDATIVVRSASNNLAKSYEEVRNMYASGPSTVTITIHSGVSKIKYCLVPYTGSDCNPNVEMNGTGTLSVPNGNIYLLCIKKYDRSGNEIGSSSPNYSNGVLHYYINTKGNGASASTSATTSPTSSTTSTSLYTVRGVYSTETSARAYPSYNSTKVYFNVNSSVGHVMICYSTVRGCTPTKKITGAETIQINQPGLWIFTIKEVYTNGTTKTDYRYVFIKNSLATPTASPRVTTTPRPTATPIVTPRPTATLTPTVKIACGKTSAISSQTIVSRYETNVGEEVHCRAVDMIAGDSVKVWTRSGTEVGYAQGIKIVARDSAVTYTYKVTTNKGASASVVITWKATAASCKDYEYFSGGKCVECPRCNGVVCFKTPTGATAATQCKGTVPAGKQITCSSASCTVSACTGNTYSKATNVNYSPTLKTTCTSCGSKTANSTHTDCVDSATSKSLTSLSFTCNKGELIIKDGSVTLRWSDYCTREYKSSANYDRYYYTCTGKGNYTGTRYQSCNIA